MFDFIPRHLTQPEYLHVFLHPMPIFGLALGAMALVVSLLMKSRQAQVVALMIIFVGALSAWPVASLGEQAYDRIESLADRDGAAWLDAHAQRASRALPVFHLLAVVVFLSMIIPWKFPNASFPLNSLTLVCTALALAAGAWICTAGGPIRHKEFRRGKPSEPAGGYDKLRR